MSAFELPAAAYAGPAPSRPLVVEQVLLRDVRAARATLHVAGAAEGSAVRIDATVQGARLRFQAPALVPWTLKIELEDGGEDGSPEQT